MRRLTWRILTLVPFCTQPSAGAAEHGVLVHSIVVESTHLHMVVTDVRGELSEFMHWFDMMSAKNLIAYYKQQHPGVHLEGIWSRQTRTRDGDSICCVG